MPNDPLALAMQPDTPSEDEYQAFLLALSESARGRAFLAEHARRSRSAESEMLLSSVQRLEGLVRSQTDAPAENPIDEVRGMLEAIRGVQAELDVSTLAMQVAKLGELVEGVQQRIDSLVVPAPAERPQPEEAPAPADDLVLAQETAFAAPEPEPVAAEPIDAEVVSDVLAEPEAVIEVEAMAEAVADVAPEAETGPEPELAPEFAVAMAEPEPEAEAENAALSLIEAIPEDGVAVGMPFAATEEAEPDAEANFAIPAVAWGEGDAPADEEPPSAAPAPAAGLAIAALVETLVVPAADEPLVPEVKVIKAGTIPPPPPFAGEDFSAGKRARAVPPPVDPLADIKALSEEERIALFT